ncbi:hypothetical protein L1049_027644 [Liquidambar formosana]|uniref:DYW domain-containing protein n=1 Tax=Liquidambar formosana TaxID=63359 RepID=A0AAP0RLC4_LIQFO
MKRSLKQFLQTSSILSLCIPPSAVRSSSTLTLKENPTQLTQPTLTHLLETLTNHTHMKQILTHMIVNNTPIDHFSLMKLIDITVSSHGWGPSALLFKQFNQVIDSEVCNLVIRCFTQLNKHLHSLFVYTQMRKHDILPDYGTFPAVLKSVAHLCRRELGRSIHCCAIQMGFDSDVYTNTALVHMYSVCLSVDDACQVFDEMPERNAVSWNALITGYTHNRMFREALDVFREMHAEGVEPGEVTMVGVLSACAHLGALNQGRWIHDYIIHNRLRLNVFVGTALIDMYGKCGVVDEAEQVFREMRAKNVYTWNVLISGYAMNGRSETALEAFSRMVMENFKPDEVTFLGILSACCHQGLVDEGRRHFMSMKEGFGLQPRIEHYGCMVDLLGRAGFLDEAQELIQTMCMKPDPVIWRALLGACRIHGNTRLGEFAIRNLLEIEPNNGENYVLLANLYARDQRWVKVEEVREMMDHRGIQKVPGCSSIEIENVVYEFVVSDTVEPGFEEVYKLLADMNKELKLAGYFVDTDMVSYDVEEEEKEHSMMYHSEKLALAFGLLKSSSKTLRIVKNLRICLDCHGFFKLVSKVYKRDITVRDRNRFHHFVGGVCSCKDYW